MEEYFYKVLNMSCVVIVVLFLTMVVTKLITSLPSKKKKSVRVPPVLQAWPPLIGTLIRFMKGPISMLREEYPKLGSVFTVKLLHKNITFLIGPEVSEHFFNAFESELSQKEVYRFNVPTFGPGVVFDADYPIRMEQFRFFADALKVDNLRSYVDPMVREAADSFSKWGESGEVDLSVELERLIILTASRCLLGREVREQLFDDVSALFHELDNGMLPISVLFPYLPIPAHRCRDRARAKLAQIFSKIIASRKRSGDKSEHDMLQCFIDSKYKEGRETTESEVTGLLTAALFAGQHTSAITSTWTGAYLMRDKHYLLAAKDEQKKLIEKHGDKINYDILSEMDVLFRCIKEALRLHPPLIVLMRASHREGKTYEIPKGHIVATSPVFANRLPHVYKDPDNFDPDRFSPGREEDKAAGPFSYISLGAGRHECLGGPFAYMQIKAIWSLLLRNFELELVSPFPETDWNAMVVGVKGKVMVRYKRLHVT
ncbi:PREDICTED: sterol 14-demethylase-like [Camelina sativa]|uniref:Sterol 14-demethylase-like n=1 Tax=Camelina sativa TaxID=90675 RepID=A0ABM0T5B1_CAMSA|nr:PREDICTED: sterol 14-demethylase-like [Camelina sativa]XP_010421092.1 PREDICTED: sterol 14-demethylase-like [Camelina sativa]